MPTDTMAIEFPAHDPEAPDPDRFRAEASYRMLRDALVAYRPPTPEGQEYSEPDWGFYAELLDKFDALGVMSASGVNAGLRPTGGALELTADELTVVLAAWPAYRRLHGHIAQSREIVWLNTALGL